MTSFKWSILFRFIRGIGSTILALSTVALAESLINVNLTSFDWTNPKQAATGIAVAIVTGFLLALSKGIREKWGHEDKSQGLVNKLPI